MKKSPSVLSEDSMKLYNQWVSGIAKRGLQPEVITVADIINRYRNRSQSPKRMPYPLDNALDFLGELFIKAAEFRRLLHESTSNPIVRESSASFQAVKELNDKLQNIQDIVFSCTEQLNKIVENQ